MNILKIQDGLKNLSDEQLAQEMRLPSGTTPQYLVMTEMQRRQKMRAEFSGSQPPKTTMAEEMSAEAAPPPGADANAQGLMGLPDQTMAGGAMRAMISGQPQQVDDMTAMPPQGMAAGGAVQFGNPFAGAQMGSAAPSAGYSPIQQYSPKYYAPETGTDYGDIRHQFDGRPTPRTPNPRVRMSEADRYGLPAGMAAPTYGTPGLNRTFTGREGQNTKYSWENDAARDAYIRYMTPPAKAAAPVTKADGGPIRMFGGGDTDRFTQGLDKMSPEELVDVYENANLRARQDAAKAEIDRRNSQTMFGKIGEGVTKYLTDDNYIGSYRIPNLLPSPLPAMRSFAENVAPAFAPINPPIMVKPTPDELARLAQRNRGGPTKPMTPAEIAAANAASGATAPQKQAAPPAAAVSGAPKKEAAPATDGGLAALLQQKQDRARAYEERANALLDKQRGDKDELANRDFNAALMQLGLGLAGSKANNLFAGVAEAGLPALQQYTAAREGRRKDEGALTDAELAILGKSNEIAQAEEKAAQDAYEAQRKYEIDQRTLDIQQQQADDDARYQDAIAAVRAGGGGGYTKGEIAWANKLEADDRDFVKAQNITDEERRLAKQILFSVRANGGDVGMTGIGSAPDPRESGLVPVN
jgi:hypothetical protein